MHELALFAGGGGGILGGKLLGWRTVCAVEIDPDARRVLLDRQRDGVLPRFPIWDEVRTFDGRGWTGEVDVVTGGFPCQDISAAGSGVGIDGKRSGLWKHMARIIREIRPPFVLVENAGVITRRGIDVVLGDLARMGFDAEWGVFKACAWGAPQVRRRMFLLAYANGNDGKERLRTWEAFEGPLSFERSEEMRRDWLGSVAGNARGGAGMADRVHRTRIIGNGQVPRVVAAAWQTLLKNATSTGNS
jgi:DNA (cytosine-5)-methyltransferase 1